MKYKAPEPTGEYAVGTFTYTVDTERPEVLGGGEASVRRVAARVFYPVLKSSVEGMKKERYMSREMTKALGKMFKFPISYDKMEADGENTMCCYKDAPVIEGAKFPLIMFSHGMSSYREGNSFLLIEIASHGYVVISVAHTYEAVLTEFDDGTSAGYDKKNQPMEHQFHAAVDSFKLQTMKGTDGEMEAVFERFQAKYCKGLVARIPQWMQDTKDAISYAKENLSHLIDLSNGIGASGHSMGGAVAYSLCLDEPEITCGINIDAGLFGEHGDKILRKPFLQACCKIDQNTMTRAYLKKTSPVYKVLFRDMQHQGFSDMKHAIPSKLLTGSLHPDKMHENLCRCHLEFFDAYLKGTKSEPELKDNDTVTVTRY